MPTRRREGRHGFGTLSGLTAVLFWSMTAPVVALAGPIDPFLFVGLEHLIGLGLFVAKWSLARENPIPELRQVPVWFLLAGLAGLPLHELTWVAALQQAPPLEATLIIYLWPLLVVVFTTVALGERLRWHHLAGGVLGLGGIAVMLMGRGLSFEGFVLLPGHFLAIVCALSWSLFAALSARQDHLSANPLAVIFAVSAAFNLGLWMARGAATPPIGSIEIVCGGGLFIMSAYIFWDYGMKHGNAPLIGVVSFLTPVLAAFHLVLLGQARLTEHLLAALILVLAGIGMARYGGRSAAAKLARIHDRA